MTIQPQDILQSITGYAQSVDPDRRIKLATIDPAYNPEISVLPKVIFDGETTLSTKFYSVIDPYTPAPNDRVVMAPFLVGNSANYVILGKIAAPSSVGTHENYVLVKSEDTNRNTTPASPTADPHLVIPVEANKAYRIDFHIRYTASVNTIGIDINFSTPSGWSAFSGSARTGMGMGPGETNRTLSLIRYAVGLPTSVVAYGTSTGPAFVQERIELIPTVDGNVTFQWKKANATSGTLTVHAGSTATVQTVELKGV